MIVKVENLQKNFCGKPVLNGMNFTVEEGDIFALIGPNGAGKTTTLRCIYGDLNPNGGKIEIFGKKLTPKIKEKIAVMTEGRKTFRRFTANDYVKMWRLLYPKWNSQVFTKFVLHYGLDLKQRVETYSIGMKTIFYIALTLATDADLLLLDEPTQHLDPLIRSEILKVINDYAFKKKKTIIISSHEIYELEEMATSFAIIKEGKVLYSNTVDDAKASHRVISTGEKIHGKIIGFIENETLVKTSEDVGRFPKFNEIILGYLNGQREFVPFD